MTLALLVLNLVLLTAVLWHQRQLRAALAPLATRAAQVPAAATLEVAGDGPLLSVEILNPMELAAKDSWYGEKFGPLLPATVTRIVYQRAAGMLKTQLKEFGVEADVQVLK